MAAIEKTHSFTFGRKAVEARVSASRRMTPQERAAAWERRLANSSAQDFIQGRVF